MSDLETRPTSLQVEMTGSNKNYALVVLREDQLDLIREIVREEVRAVLATKSPPTESDSA